jgi:hypothetical protein
MHAETAALYDLPCTYAMQSSHNIGLAVQSLNPQIIMGHMTGTHLQVVEVLDNAADGLLEVEVLRLVEATTCAR